MEELSIGNPINLKGFITQKGYLLGKSLEEIEQLLGYSRGRLKQGAWICELLRLPTINEFELAGYSQVASHRFDKEFNTSEYDKDKNALKIRKEIAMSVWLPIGARSLIKVIPITQHNDSISNDEQYPPGSGIPQWRLTSSLPFNVKALVKGYPQGKFINH